jgi:hypothetical protein
MTEPEWILMASEDLNSRDGEIIPKAAFTYKSDGTMKHFC